LSRKEILLWDWPLRLFHWLLVIAVVGAYLTGELGGTLNVWHDYFGNLVLGLLVFRLIWGFTGSTYARFANFFPTYAKLRAYLQGRWHGLGHNPLGAISVLSILAVLLAIAVTGLFANDDIGYEGPFYPLVAKQFSDQSSGWHNRLVSLLIGLLVIHLGAIAYYWLIKKINLVQPMLTGKKKLAAEMDASSAAPMSQWRFLLSVLTAVLIIFLVRSKALLEYLSVLSH